MNPADAVPPEIPLELGDLRNIALTRFQHDVDVMAMLSRVLPNSQVGQVEVAAFNSSI
ncbi:hypothetical protein [Microtetraspora malaysiensis]|uniref:FXSXX-COOH protein n=1 Tax=Microtetraspora malaysiensis TaxID=161358 RepID=A0ABW6SP29_9ACTN